MVTGQVPVTLEWKNTPGAKHALTKIKWSTRAHTIACALNASTRKILKVKSGVRLRCARSVLVQTSQYSRLDRKPATPLATQKRLPRICYARYLSLRIRTSDSSQLEKIKEKKKNMNNRKGKMKRKEKEIKKKSRRRRKKREGKNSKLADPRN